MAAVIAPPQILEISKPLDDGRHECLLCPHHCRLRDGQAGVCLARQGSEFGVMLAAYGQISGLAVEPVEKKPIFHYRPGIRVLSVGGWGCNLDCDFCVNFQISQKNRSKDAKTISPKELIDLAAQKGCKGVCFTYNEPIIYYEYVMDTAAECRQKGLCLVLKTNAYAEPGPWRELCSVADAMNIDWKGTDNRYRTVAKTDGETTLLRLAEAVEMGVHVEISIPVYHDSELDEYGSFREYLSSLSPDIPVHLLKMYPAYKTSYVALTSETLLKRLHSFMSEKLRYVYAANVFADWVKPISGTRCYHCGADLVKRLSLNADLLVTEPCCDRCPIRF